MLGYFTGLYNDPEYLNVTVIFSDFTKAIVMLSVKDISEIAYYILKHAPKIRHINNSILVNKPLATAYSMLYATIMRAMPLYKSKMFSTHIEAANFIAYDADMLEELMKTSFSD
jgi:hypothetical protein